MKHSMLLTILFLLLLTGKAISQNVQVFDNLSQLQSTARGTGVTAADLLGYSTPGDGGGGRFAWISGTVPSAAPAPSTGSVFVTATLSPGGYWQRQVNDNTINVKWFGLVSGDNSSTARTNNNSGLDDAINAAVYLQNQTSPGSSNFNGYKVYIPGATTAYFFDHTISINKSIELFGDGNYYAGNNNTQLTMKAGMTGPGIKVFRTPFTYDFSISIHNLTLSYVGIGAFNTSTNSTNHGIESETLAHFEKVYVFGFPGDGFHIDGTSPHIIDFSRIIDCKSEGNAGNGFYIDGDDGQACTFNGCDSRGNYLWGYYENSGGGNLYIACDAHTNGPGAAGNTSGGGAFHISGSASNRSSLLNCYTEQDNGLSESISGNSLVVGGIRGADFNPPSASTTNTDIARIDGADRNVQLRSGVVVPGDVSYGIIGLPPLQSKLRAGGGLTPMHGLGLLSVDEPSNTSYALTQNWSFLEANKPRNQFIAFQRGNSWAGNQTAFIIAKSTTSKDHFGIPNSTGPTDNVGGRIAFPYGLSLRSFDNVIQDTATPPSFPVIQQYRSLMMAEVAPTVTGSGDAYYHSHEYGVGDFVLNTNLTTPSIIGWRCIAAGNPGTWTVLNSASFSAANNGLSISGSNVQLGGSALIQNTSIDLATYNLDLKVGATNKIGFTNDASAGAVINLNGNRYIYSKGTLSTYVGQNSGNFSNTGYNNTTLGTNTLAAITTGYYNVAIGSNTLAATTTGTYNTAIGNGALTSLTTTYCNTALGNTAMAANTGSWNTAVGNGALRASGAGTENVAIGGDAMAYNTGGQLNVAIGRQALLNNLNGYSNAAVGSHALENITGNHNVGLGTYSGPPSGSSLTSASSKLYINSGTSSNTPLIGGDFSSHKVAINKDLSAATLFYTLDVNGTGHYSNGVLIGTTSYADSRFTTAQSSGYNLLVAGKILTEEVVIQAYASWPDYVFGKDYKLRPLTEVEAFIKQNQHLPGIASAAAMKQKEGIAIGKMQTKLLEKVEELTLYAIETEKKNTLAEEKIKSLEERLQKLEQLLTQKK